MSRRNRGGSARRRGGAPSNSSEPVDSGEKGPVVGAEIANVDDVPTRLVADPQTPGAWMVRINGIDQSFIDPDPAHLEFDYMRRIGDHIDLHAPEGERLRVVHIGGAGMTLARYVAHTRPTSAQIVLEPDETLTAEVRAVAPLPRNSGIKVRPIDGRAGLAAMPDEYADIVIADAFDNGSVPGELATAEFFADVRRVLVADGLLLMNITDRHPFAWAKRAIATLIEAFPEVMVSAESATWKGRRFGNLVAAATSQPLPREALWRRAAGAPFPYQTVTDERLTKFVGGAQPFTDATAQASPAPLERLTWYG